MRNNKGQFIHNKWKNWRIWVLSFSILSCVILSNYGNVVKVYVAEVQQQAFLLPVIVEPEKTIEEKFKRYFPKSHVTMLAIAKAESGLNNEAKNWNCYYNKTETVVYETKVKGSHSRSCKKEHRKYAWSVDCGVLQLSVKGKVCPVEDIDTHLEKAAELSKVQGKEAWVVYNTGAYKKHLTSK